MYFQEPVRSVMFSASVIAIAQGKDLSPQNVRHLVQLVLRPRLLYGASIFSPREVDLSPIRAVWHSAAQWILGAFRTTPTTSLLTEAGLPPGHLLFKHARLRYALRIACAQPSTNPAAAALPPSFLTTAPWRDPFTVRYEVPYPMTREWNSEPTRTWGRPLSTSTAWLRFSNYGPGTHSQCVTWWDSPVHSASPHCRQKQASIRTGSSASPHLAMRSSSSLMDLKLGVK